MSYKILPTKEFANDTKNIDSSILNRIKKKIEEVAENPKRYKHLNPSLNSYCKIRIGKLRIIFSYNVEKQELYPEKIILGHRY